MKIKVKKLSDEAIVPKYAYQNDAGFDFYAIEDMTIEAGQRVRIPTGIALEIPDGYTGLIWDKSSIPYNLGLTTVGGVFDAGYRGEILILTINLSNEACKIEKGQKIAQMLIQEVKQAEFEVVEELGDSHRGTGGFGSSGK